MKDRLLDWTIPAVIVAATFAFIFWFVGWMRDTQTSIYNRCAGDVRMYYGEVAGNGVLAVDPYDSACYDAAHPAAPEPTYPGDSHTGGKR